MAIVGVMDFAIDDLLGNTSFRALASEYDEEVTTPGTPTLAEKLELYRPLEASRQYSALTATHDGLIVGLLTLLAPLSSPFGRITATSETFFIAQKYRPTGAGLRLVRLAEDRARGLGSPNLLISLHQNSDLLRVLPRVGYSEFNHAFLKKVDGVDADESIPLFFDSTPTRPQ